MLKCEIRADNTLHIEGYVNAVERDSRPVMVPSLGRCVEQVRAGVFGAALAENPDVELLENHDHSRKLGSTSDGVLTLSEDSIGLRASADISDPDMITKARTGQLKGWSFGFVTTSSEVENRADNIPRRVVTGMKLSEVSLIDGKYTPCYAGTLVEVRAVDDSAEMVEFRADEDIEIVDYSLGDEELRYNPYHDPSNGRFCSGGGSGGGGVLVVEKGQKGKGVYVVPNEKFQNNADNDMYEMAKYSATKSGAVYLEYTESDGKTKRYAATDRPFSRNWADVDSIPPNAGGVYRKSFSQKQIDYTNMDTDALESMEKEQKQIVNNALWAANMKVSDSKMASKFKSMLDAETELNYISTALAFKKGKTKVFTRSFALDESTPEEQRSLADEVIEDMDNSSEEDASSPDYSYYERAIQLLELRYNPYHDPSNGRFCSGGGGGGGGVLFVGKGQKGKGVYVVDVDHDDEYEQWKADKANAGGGISAADMDRINPINSNDIKDVYYQKSLSPYDAKYINSPVAETRDWARNMLKYDTVLVNEDMPKLTGSEKQIAWAKSIRNRAVEDQIDRIMDKLPVHGSDYSKREAFIKQANSFSNTNNINNFSDAVNKLLSVDKKGAFYYFKNTTSASDIINKYR